MAPPVLTTADRWAPAVSQVDAGDLRLGGPARCDMPDPAWRMLVTPMHRIIDGCQMLFLAFLEIALRRFLRDSYLTAIAVLPECNCGSIGFRPRAGADPGRGSRALR